MLVDGAIWSSRRESEAADDHGDGTVDGQNKYGHD